MGREARAGWLEDYRAVIDEARDQILKLLTSEWLVTDVETDDEDRRRRELIQIRQSTSQNLLSVYTLSSSLPGTTSPRISSVLYSWRTSLRIRDASCMRTL